MIEISLVVIIFLLLIHNFSIEKQFLTHLKQLEDKLAGIAPKDEVETLNDIKENPYRDISDVSPNEIIK